ncbi:hypothetical protein [Fischerella thermalis]|nr:hypothetical protein [Fischerella thermalis]
MRWGDWETRGQGGQGRQGGQTRQGGRLGGWLTTNNQQPTINQ